MEQDLRTCSRIPQFFLLFIGSPEPFRLKTFLKSSYEIFQSLFRAVVGSRIPLSTSKQYAYRAEKIRSRAKRSPLTNANFRHFPPHLTPSKIWECALPTMVVAKGIDGLERRLLINCCRALPLARAIQWFIMSNLIWCERGGAKLEFISVANLRGKLVRKGFEISAKQQKLVVNI